MTATSHSDDGFRSDQTRLIAKAPGGLAGQRPATNDPADATSERVTLPVGGLACGGGGAIIVERSLQRTVGVLRVYVNPATEMAYVEYDPRQTGPASLAEAITSSGYRTEE